MNQDLYQNFKLNMKSLFIYISIVGNFRFPLPKVWCRSTLIECIIVSPLSSLLLVCPFLDPLLTDEMTRLPLT